MFLEIEHRITFQYSDYVSDSWMELRVEPKETPHQKVRRFLLAVGPPSKVHAHTDWLGNHVHAFSIPKYHDKIEIVAKSIVETTPAALTFQDLPNGHVDPSRLGPESDFLLFDGPIHDSEELRALAQKIKTDSQSPVAEIVAATGLLVYNEIEYRPNVTAYHSTVQDALQKKAGVCQDIAQITIGLLRLKGVPARYVSGYLDVDNPEGELAESHAWVEFLAPDHTWVAYDPTNQCFPDHRYAVVAHGRNYDDVPPNKGVYRGHAQETLHATVQTRLMPTSDETGFRETLESLDVPVYAKLPVRPAAILDDQNDDLNQQQQQQ